MARSRRSPAGIFVLMTSGSVRMSPIFLRGFS
jgi:hypothetical protein